jgi:hypothetical protein
MKESKPTTRLALGFYLLSSNTFELDFLFGMQRLKIHHLKGQNDEENFKP